MTLERPTVICTDCVVELVIISIRIELECTAQGLERMRGGNQGREELRGYVRV
jgi:hypothetical protein